MAENPDELRVGVVGVGHLGAAHARIYAGLPGARLVGVQDREPRRAQAVANALGCQAYAEAGELGQAVDALSVAVPARAHAEVALPCLQRGVAVLIEKPMAASVAAAEALLAASAASGAPIMVGHVERWNGAFRRVRHLIQRPRFIEGHRLSSFADRGLDVDVIFDLMIHDLDLVATLSTAELRQVAAIGVPVLTTSADIANVRLEFTDGLVANLTASRVSRERLRKLRIFQEDAYFSIDFAARRAEVVTRSTGSAAGGALDGIAAAANRAAANRAAANPAVANPAAADPAALLRHEVIDAGGDPEPLAAEIEAFVEAVRGGRQPKPGPEEGLRAVVLAERVAEEMAGAARRSPAPESAARRP